MKLQRLWVDNYKNLRDCSVEFVQPHDLNAIIGSNGSGKSNLIEAILHILIGAYFAKSPPFNFEFEFEAQRRKLVISGMNGKLSVTVDGENKPAGYFAARLRDGAAQVYYPELTFVYYSGECQRVRALIKRYQRAFQKLTREPEGDRLRPLFVESTNEQSKVILLALFAHRHTDILEKLGLKGIVNISLELRSPKGFNPEQHEPKLWNTEGAVRRIVAAIDETANDERNVIRSNDVALHAAERLARIEGRTVEEMGFSKLLENAAAEYSVARSYYFNNEFHGSNSIGDLANRLAKSGDNLYLALEHLRVRGIFISLTFQLRGRDQDALFEFEQLSEGEKQLLAVVGALKLINQRENLVLLDEPDTHLNPHWTWDFPSLLSGALDDNQNRSSTVLMATHNPVMISGLTKDQVLLAHLPNEGEEMFTRPRRNPRGQGVANILCSSEFFGLPSSLDKETQKLLDERVRISVKRQLDEVDKSRLKELNQQLQIITPGVSERDPEFAEFLRQRHEQRQG